MIDICRIWRLTPRSCFTLSGDWSHWDSLIFSERTVDWEISIVNSSMLYSDASKFCSFGVRDTDWTADSRSPPPCTHRVSHWCAWALLRAPEGTCPQGPLTHPSSSPVPAQPLLQTLFNCVPYCCHNQHDCVSIQVDPLHTKSYIKAECTNEHVIILV